MRSCLRTGVSRAHRVPHSPAPNALGCYRHPVRICRWGTAHTMPLDVSSVQLASWLSITRSVSFARRNPVTHRKTDLFTLGPTLLGPPRARLALQRGIRHHRSCPAVRNPSSLADGAARNVWFASRCDVVVPARHSTQASLTSSALKAIWRGQLPSYAVLPWPQRLQDLRHPSPASAHGIVQCPAVALAQPDSEYNTPQPMNQWSRKLEHGLERKLRSVAEWQRGC